MNYFRFAISSIVLLAPSLAAQESSFQDSLLDQFAGTWVLSGTIAGRATTHDVYARWILAHQYMQFHEISREKDSAGAPAYEAIVFIGWDEPSKRYACLWLDNTGGGGLKGDAIAYAKREENRMAFLFKGSDGSLFHTRFIREKESDSWQWMMDGEENGTLQPFARVTLKRR